MRTLADLGRGEGALEGKSYAGSEIGNINTFFVKKRNLKQHFYYCGMFFKRVAHINARESEIRFFKNLVEGMLPTAS